MRRNNPERARVRCAAVLALAFLSASASADVVTDWNATATSVTAGGSSAPQARAYALVHAAIHDAMNAVEHRYEPYAVALHAPGGASADAAAAGAAHAVLSTLVPAQRGALDAALQASLAKIPDGQARTDGLATGKQVADRLLAMRSDDGFTAKVDVKPQAPGPGVWELTPGFATPLLTQWSRMKPMAITRLADFDAGPPPDARSAQLARDLKEVKEIGARNSRTRTADQTAAAIFWATQSMALWNAVAQAASRAHGLSPLENARLFALLNVAGFDSAIVTMEQKYRYMYWRPYTAIRAQGGRNADWEPLLQTPGFPEYPSAHCSASGAAAEILRGVFRGDRVDASFTFPPGVGTTRRWKTFSEIEAEVVNARVWGGIHFRTADEVGIRIGRKIGEHVMQTRLLPVETAGR